MTNKEFQEILKTFPDNSEVKIGTENGYGVLFLSNNNFLLYTLNENKIGIKNNPYSKYYNTVVIE